MPGQLKIFVHALLVTLSVFAARLLDEWAQEHNFGHSTRDVLLGLSVFTAACWLEWLWEKRMENRAERARAEKVNLDSAGYADGSWVDVLAAPGDAEHIMGSFIRITSTAAGGFQIEGNTFDKAGREIGEFDAVGYRHPKDPRTIFYAFDGYHYAEGVHNRKHDRGIGYYRFSDPSGENATSFNGVFYGEGSELLRHIKGNRVDDVPKGLDALKRRGKAVVDYLAAKPQPPRPAGAA